MKAVEPARMIVSPACLHFSVMAMARLPNSLSHRRAHRFVMPFTVSHVAAVLPLRRHCSIDVFAALAIGSMMPDMHYFLPLLRKNWPLPSHQLISLPLFCLPVGWLLWRLWRPIWTSNVLVDCEAPPSPALWRVLLALAIGTLTHLAWDAFTHVNSVLAYTCPCWDNPCSGSAMRPFPAPIFCSTQAACWACCCWP